MFDRAREVRGVACYEIVCLGANGSLVSRPRGGRDRRRIQRKRGGIADDDLSLIRSIQLLQGLVRADREILMECSESCAKHGRLVDLERQGHPGIKIVVVRKVLLNLVSQAG